MMLKTNSILLAFPRKTIVQLPRACAQPPFSEIRSFRRIKKRPIAITFFLLAIILCVSMLYLRKMKLKIAIFEARLSERLAQAMKHHVHNIHDATRLDYVATSHSMLVESDRVRRESAPTPRSDILGSAHPLLTEHGWTCNDGPHAISMPDGMPRGGISAAPEFKGTHAHRNDASHYLQIAPHAGDSGYSRVVMVPGMGATVAAESLELAPRTGDPGYSRVVMVPGKGATVAAESLELAPGTGDPGYSSVVMVPGKGATVAAESLELAPRTGNPGYSRVVMVPGKGATVAAESLELAPRTGDPGYSRVVMKPGDGVHIAESYEAFFCF